MLTCTIPAQYTLPPSALADEVSGSLLRLLHQLSSCLAAAEALARCTPPAVPPLLGAMRWGTGAAGEGLHTVWNGNGRRWKLQGLK